MSYEELYSYFHKYNQDHVFMFWDELNLKEKFLLLDQCKKINLKELDDLIKFKTSTSINTELLSPVDYIKYTNDKNNKIWSHARKIGEEAIRNGRVAVFTPAGGQGTRLGLNAPKGTFPISTVSKKSLFQVFSEKILYTSKKYNIQVPWYIMTSESNHDETVSFFEKNTYFGLNKISVFFLVQGTMPVVDFEGKLLLSKKHQIATSPNGHGGSFKALANSGSLDYMRSKGIDIVSFFQVDNVLVNCIDPYFIGFHIIRKSDVSSKVCIKTDPNEKVGLIVNNNNKISTIEYSDFPRELIGKKDEDGLLIFNCASIGIHLFDRDYISLFTSGYDKYTLPFHLAIKKVDCIDSNGYKTHLENPNGIKFEMFGFDAMQFSSSVTIFETLREEEFSPLKNAYGTDSPTTVFNDQLYKFSKWIKEAGGSIYLNKDGMPNINFEISPLYASSKEDFLAKYDGRKIKNNTIFE